MQHIFIMSTFKHLADAFIQSNLQCIHCTFIFLVSMSMDSRCTIIQSITSSEMCSLLLTHPSAHTLGAVGTHAHTLGAVDTHTHTLGAVGTHTLGAVDTHTHTLGAVGTHTWSSGHTHLEQWAHTLGAVGTHTWSSGHTHLEQWAHTHLEQWAHTHLEQWAVDAAAPGSSRGFGALLKCLSRVQYLPEPRFEPITSGYKSDALSTRATTAPPIMQNNFNILQLVKINRKHDKMMRDGMMHFLKLVLG